MGLVDKEEQGKEDDFLNPRQVEAKKKERREKEDAARLNLLDEV